MEKGCSKYRLGGEEGDAGEENVGEGACEIGRDSSVGDEGDYGTDGDWNGTAETVE
jgi:hypothetical protein